MALGAEVAYWLVVVFRAEHCKYNTRVTADGNELVCSKVWIGIVPSNAFITELHYRHCPQCCEAVPVRCCALHRLQGFVTFGSAEESTGAGPSEPSVACKSRICSMR